MRCKNFRKLLVGASKNQRLVAYARCKQWDCAYCADKNRQIWRAAIIDAINRMGKDRQYEENGIYVDENGKRIRGLYSKPGEIVWQFWTITAHRRARKTATSIKNIQDGWVKIYQKIKYISRKNDCDTVYIRVYEPHKKGAIHTHLLIGWIPKISTGNISIDALPDTRWLKDNAAKSGMGYQAKIYILPVGNAGYVAAYIAKYMTKLQTPLPKGTRRVQASQGFITTMHPDKDENAEFKWSVMDNLTERDAVQWWKNGMDIVDISTKKIITVDDFNEDGEYKVSEQ